jgi:hypothetical protein
VGAALGVAPVLAVGVAVAFRLADGVADGAADGVAEAGALDGAGVVMGTAPLPARHTPLPSSVVTRVSRILGSLVLLTMCSDSGATLPVAYPPVLYTTTTSRSETLPSGASALAPGTAGTILDVWAELPEPQADASPTTAHAASDANAWTRRRTGVPVIERGTFALLCLDRATA